MTFHLEIAPLGKNVLLLTFSLGVSVWFICHPLYVFLLVFQVQLLVSEQDVENYKQIKTDLDQLRLTVEKSELWVEKSGVYSGEDLGVRPSKEQNIEVVYHPFMVSSIQHQKAKFRISAFFCQLFLHRIYHFSFRHLKSHSVTL